MSRKFSMHSFNFVAVNNAHRAETLYYRTRYPRNLVFFLSRSQTLGLQRHK